VRVRELFAIDEEQLFRGAKFSEDAARVTETACAIRLDRTAQRDLQQLRIEIARRQRGECAIGNRCIEQFAREPQHEVRARADVPARRALDQRVPIDSDGANDLRDVATRSDRDFAAMVVRRMDGEMQQQILVRQHERIDARDARRHRARPHLIDDRYIVGARNADVPVHFKRRHSRLHELRQVVCGVRDAIVAHAIRAHRPKPELLHRGAGSGELRGGHEQIDVDHRARRKAPVNERHEVRAFERDHRNAARLQRRRDCREIAQPPPVATRRLSLREKRLDAVCLRGRQQRRPFGGGN